MPIGRDSDLRGYVPLVLGSTLSNGHECYLWSNLARSTLCRRESLSDPALMAKEQIESLILQSVVQRHADYLRRPTSCDFIFLQKMCKFVILTFCV